MRKAIIVICGLVMLLCGLGGLLFPVFGYLWAREWATFIFTLSFPFFPCLSTFTGWLLVTGGTGGLSAVGLVFGADFGSFSSGGIVTVGFNLLSDVMTSLVDAVEISVGW